MSNKLQGKTILELEFRKRFGLNIIAIVRGNETIVEIMPGLKLKTEDLIAVVGTKDSILILKFERYLTS